MAYTVESLMCILEDLSLNIYKYVYIPIEMEVSYGSVFSPFILSMRSHCRYYSAICFFCLFVSFALFAFNSVFWKCFFVPFKID